MYMLDSGYTSYIHALMYTELGLYASTTFYQLDALELALSCLCCIGCVEAQMLPSARDDKLSKD